MTGLARKAAAPMTSLPGGVAMCDVLGETVWLDPSGMAVLPEHHTALIADLHLEKGSAFAERRQFLPPYDTLATLQLIGAALARFDVSHVVALGDTFHDDGGEGRLSDPARMLLDALTRDHDWTWVSGNHDARPGPYSTCAEMRLGPLKLKHEPDGVAGTVAGHLHPGAVIRMRGRAIRRKAFLSDGERLILPAFGSYTGSLDCFHPAFDGMIDRRRMQAHMIGKDSVHGFPVERLLR